MLKVKVPNNNINERKYILDIILNEFMGLNYQIETYDNKSEVYEIELENKNKLIFEDHFFNRFINDLEYLKLENIPKTIFKELIKNNAYILEDNMPIIFGKNKLELKTSNSHVKTITCGIDIFASSFFMLTRWEEYVNKNRDKHDRFSAYESLAYKNNFLDRPIVNEYIEMLKNMLFELGLNQKTKSKKYQVCLTHDVDFIYKWDSIGKFLRHLIGDIVLRKSIRDFFSSIVYYAQVKLKKKNDPFDTFDYLMDISDSLKVKSYFFFMAEGITKFDNNYKSNSSESLKLVSKIKKRGHHIGLHPSYDAYNNKNQLRKEKLELEENFGIPIVFGREHFLRFEVPNTWQIWEDNNMKWDSTVGYADKEGFRCGVCYEYSVFNILKRKKLKLKEKPLIVMEASFIYQNNISAELMEEEITNLIDKVKKYNGEFVFLWHNSSFNIKEWKHKREIYKRVLNDF